MVHILDGMPAPSTVFTAGGQGVIGMAFVVSIAVLAIDINDSKAVRRAENVFIGRRGCKEREGGRRVDRKPRG